MTELNAVSLFSGVGGMDLGLERAGIRTVGQVEISEFCRRVLAKHWPKVDRHDDVRTARAWWASVARPPVHLVHGGFPCQDVSNSGLRAGIDGARSGLWADMARFIDLVRPRFVIVENTAGLLVRGMGRVLGDLAELGFDAEWDMYSACSLGAPHPRGRVFIVAYPQGLGLRTGGGTGQRPPLLEPVRRGQEHRGPWSSQPRPVGVAYGAPSGVDRRRAAGNAVVPQVAEHVGRLVVAAADRFERVAA